MKAQMLLVSLNSIYYFNDICLIALNKSMFEYKYAIGRGGFGKVWRVTCNRIKGEKQT